MLTKSCRCSIGLTGNLLDVITTSCSLIKKACDVEQLSFARKSTSTASFGSMLGEVKDDQLLAWGVHFKKLALL